MYTQDDMTTNTPSPMFRPFFAVKYLSMTALAVTLAAPAQALEKVAQSSGDWSSIAWVVAGAPTSADTVHIEGDFTVNYNSGTSQAVSRLYVGDNTGGFTSPNGTLEISSGTITGGANAAGLYIVGRSDGSVGTINITGGTLASTGSTNGGGLQVGLGAGSQGTVNISSGALTLTGGVQLGLGAGATGTMKVTGGTVTTGTGSGSGIFYVGARSSGVNSGYFEQTGGTVNIDSGETMGIGFAGNDSRAVGTALITGGTFNGNIKIGRAVTTNGTGSGKLTIGPAADVNGLGQAWDISSTGEIVFKLGSNSVFNAVDLTAATTTALIFSEAGAKLTIDGSSLIYDEDAISITLMVFDTNPGSDPIVGLNNVVYGYTGFDPGYTPQLEWTNSALVLHLTAVPEPSTMALAIAAGLGWVAIRRRRR